MPSTSLDAQQPVVVNEAASRMPPPRVAVSVASPSLLRVIVSIDSLDVSWLKVDVVANAGADSVLGAAALRRQHLTETTWLPVQPGQYYATAARLESPVVRVPTRRADWSAPVALFVIGA